MMSTNKRKGGDSSGSSQGGGGGERSGPITDDKGIPITSVGYSFEKHFNGHGWFKGKVVAIRPGAVGGKDRRCKYEDGDLEDLSMGQLYRLHYAAQKKKQQGKGGASAASASGTGTSARGGADNKSNRPKKRPKKQVSGVGDGKKRPLSRQQEQPGDIFAGLEFFAPVDQAAEATLSKASARASSGAASVSGGGEAVDDATEEDETGAWLAQVAVALGASSHGAGSSRSGGGGRKRSSNQISPSASARSMSPPPPRFVGGATTGASAAVAASVSASASRSRTDSPIPFVSTTTATSRAGKFVAPGKPSSSMECLTSLADVARGERHNTRVFRANDKKRLVGEVILEHGAGYVEVIIGNDHERGRLRTYVVAPEGFNVGDKIPAHLPLPERPSGGQGKTPPKGAVSGGGGGKKSVRSKKSDGTQLCQQINPNASVSRGGSSVGTPSKRSSITSASAASSDIASGLPSNARNEKVSVADMFYWCCGDCTMANAYNKSKCSVCGEKRKAGATQSPLLEVATIAAAAAESVEEAKESVPTFNRYAIPDVVLFHLVSSKEGGKVTSSVDSSRKTLEPAPTNVNDYFYWICGFCSLKNRFSDNNCDVCKKPRSSENASASSTVLGIALKASKKAHTVSEAVNSIPISQRRSIPESVLRSLVTCIAVVGGSQKKRQQRCRNTKAPGLDYCSYHCNDPLLLSAGGVYGLSDQEDTDSKMASNGENTSDDVAVVSGVETETEKAAAPDNFEAMSTNLLQHLHRSSSLHYTNNRRWDIRGVEDSILSQTTGPFPLGLMVRKFFPRYGFHDGRIIKVLRQNVYHKESGEIRPVLLYRVLYNDGDCEDFMSHEINSLRQIYDSRNVKSTALPSEQIPKGSLFEMYHQETPFVMVEGHHTPANIRAICPDEGGLVDIKVCKALGQPWLTINQSDLLKLQLSIDRMLNPNESIVVGPAKASSLVTDESIHDYNEKLCMRTNTYYEEAFPSSTAFRIRPDPLNEGDSKQLAPLLEWPGAQDEGAKAASNKGTPSSKKASESGGVDKDYECEITSSLWLVTNVEDDADVVCEDTTSTQYMDDNECVRKCVSRSQTGWDPANASPYIRWDPFRNIICSHCGTEENDERIVICDGCNRGYHTYCLRPVMVNVPTTDWYCDRCRNIHDAARQPYTSFLAELEKDPSAAMTFLDHNFSAAEFYKKHADGLMLFGPETAPHIRRKTLGSSKSKATAQMGHLYFSWNIKPDDLVLPRPPISVEGYNTVILSWVAAMKYVGMSKYSEDLTYSDDVPESMNDASLEDGVVEPLPRRVEEIFREFKMNLSQGVFPPLQIIHDPNVGFTTVALEDIKKHTVIAEYVGEVTTVEHTAGSSSDSLMFLLSTGDNSTSLMIDPTATGNIARFLSGINNRSNLSRKNANVRTRRFVMDGQCRVALFTSRKITAGETLHYDYNAGIEGKSLDEWKEAGFYDTSNFF